MSIGQEMAMEHSSEAADAWFVLVGDAEAGPYTNSVVQLYIEIGELSLDDMCWREGFSDWIPLRQTGEFEPHQPPKAQSAEPSLATPASPAEAGPPSEGAAPSLPPKPAIHDGRNKPPQNEKPMTRLWRGESALPKNYWVKVYSLTALPVILAVGLWQSNFTSQPSRTAPVVVVEDAPPTSRLADVTPAAAQKKIHPPKLLRKAAEVATMHAKADDLALAFVKPPDVKPSPIEPLAVRPFDIRPLDVDLGMRVISAIPIYAAIKENYPEDYSKMEEVLRDGFLKGWSARDLRTRILPFLAMYYQKSLPTASPATIEKFIRIVAAEQEAILQVNAPSCMAYMKGDASGYRALDIPAGLAARELEIGAEIIRSTGNYKGPAIKEKEIQKSLRRVVSGASKSLGMSVGEYVKGLNLKLDGTTNCEVFIAFYKHLVDVTSAEKPKLLRFVVQTIVSPKA